MVFNWPRTYTCLWHYVFSFFSTFSSNLSRSMIGFTRRCWILTFFIKFHVDWFLHKCWVVAISTFAGSNVTMPCGEIGASFNNSPFVCCGGFLLLFDYLNLVVLKILWADDNWFSSIITLLQYPMYFNY